MRLWNSFAIALIIPFLSTSALSGTVIEMEPITLPTLAGDSEPLELIRSPGETAWLPAPTWPVVSDGAGLRLNPTETLPELSGRGPLQRSQFDVDVLGMSLNLADGLGAPSYLIPIELASRVDLRRGLAFSSRRTARLGSVSIDTRPQTAQQNDIFVLNALLERDRPNSAGLLVRRERETSGRLTLLASGGPRDFYFSNQNREANAGDLVRFGWTRNWQTELGSGQSLLAVARDWTQNPGSTQAPRRGEIERRGLITAHTWATVPKGLSQIRGRVGAVWSEGRFDEGSTNATGSTNRRIDLELTQRSQLDANLWIESHGLGQLNQLEASYLSTGVLQETPFRLGQDLVHDDGIIRYQLYWTHSVSRGLLDAGLSAEFRQDWVQYGASIQQGHTAPALSDRLAQNENFSGNEALRSERARQIEAWLKSQEPGRVNWRLSAVSVWTNDLIESAQLDAQRWTKINRAEASLFSVTSQIDTPRMANWLGASWSGSAGLIWSQGSDRLTGQRLPLLATWEGELSLLGRWSSSRELRFRAGGTEGRFQRGPSEQITSVDVPLDLDISARLGSFRIGVLRLFDRPSEQSAGWPRPQRQLTLEYTQALE